MCVFECESLSPRSFFVSLTYSLQRNHHHRHQCVKFLVPLFPLPPALAATPAVAGFLGTAPEGENTTEPAGADAGINTMRRRDGKSCLHWCCRNGHIEVMDHLLHHYYKPSALHTLGTGDGTTPVHIACFGGNVPLLRHMYFNYFHQREEQEEEQEQELAVATFHHQNNWGCLPEHFACMSLTAQPALFDFLVDVVHKGNRAIAAKYFFCCTNSEGMTPVHKWLLYLSKDGRPVETSLAWISTLRASLSPCEVPVPAPGDVVTWIQERCGYLVGKFNEEQNEQLASIMGRDYISVSPPPAQTVPAAAAL